jgi:hypothetical protein
MSGQVILGHEHLELCGDLTVGFVQKGDEVGTGVGLADVGNDCSGGHAEGGEVSGAVALAVAVVRAGAMGSMGSVGAARVSAWICGVSSMGTRRRPGGSCSAQPGCGSFPPCRESGDTLKLSSRQGLNRTLARSLARSLVPWYRLPRA